jgi:tRNA-specific 2-thiouridylase
MNIINLRKQNPKTAILLSGGVDSLVAAHMLKQNGHNVIGIHFVTGYEKPLQESGPAPAMESGADTEAAAQHTRRLLSGQLHIPIEIMDCRQAFQSRVVDYFTRTYAEGKTPNPCLVCNPLIKFGTVLAFAESLGAKRLATGHYARVHVDPEGGVRLLCGKDRAKDQSYFLAMLPRDKLSKVIFPLGDMTKQATKHMARQSGLKPVTPRESQDVCFIRENQYGDFLRQQPGFNAAPGPIKDTRGNIIGRHPGLHLFTLGQRRGINCPAEAPYYVTGIDPATNCLTVGFKQDTLARTCMLKDINWISPQPDTEIDVSTRVRYRHQAAPSRLIPMGGKQAQIVFDSPQSAISPGQGAVFYKGDEVLGGGFIV